MLIQCRHCGAPLDVASSRRVVQCAYCGTYSRTASAQTLAPETPSDFRAPPTWVPPPEAKARSAPLPRRARTPVGTKLAAVAVMALLFAGGLAWAGGSMTTALKEWYSVPCLVDADGDGVRDVAGLMATPGSSSWTATVIDGRNGDVLWTGERFSVDGNPQPICVGGTWFGVAGAGFRATFWDASDLERGPLVVQLRDRLRRYGAGPGCARLETIDGSVQGLSLPSGDTAAECVAERVQEAHAIQTLVDEDGERVIEDGEGRWVLSARDRGTPFLALRHERAGVEAWSRELRYLAADSDNLAMHRVTDREADLLVVYGSNPSNDDEGVLLGIDASTGQTIFTRPQGSRWSGRLRGFEPNGPLLIAHWGYGLHAYDPATGKRVWHIGGR